MPGDSPMVALEVEHHLGEVLVKVGSETKVPPVRKVVKVLDEYPLAQLEIQDEELFLTKEAIVTDGLVAFVFSVQVLRSRKERFLASKYFPCSGRTQREVAGILGDPVPAEVVELVPEVKVEDHEETSEQS